MDSGVQRHKYEDVDEGLRLVFLWGLVVIVLLLLTYLPTIAVIYFLFAHADES